MSLDDFNSPLMRAGRLACACPEQLRQESLVDNRATLATGFGLAVLAQALVLSVLPEQSRLLAPNIQTIGLPFALLLIGAALASFPAAFLVDAFGRRAAFGLGASLGAAGGALCAFALTRGNFFGLCLGAFWLGLAQGFALFYRHVAAQGPSAQGALATFGGGALGALLAPAVIALAQTPGATLMSAAALHICALALSVRLPHMRGEAFAAPVASRLSSSFMLATAAGAFAWFIMAASMLHGPLTLAVCSAAPAFIGGAMGWHLLAMYGPAALAARWPDLLAPRPGALIGLSILLLGALAIYAGASVMSVTLGMLGVGVGWSLVNIAALRLLHDGAQPSRFALALHDVFLLVAAAAGALIF